MDEYLSPLLSAPWTTVLTLAAGYAGYFVAHVGLREHHHSLDQAFRVVFYGFWGVFSYVLLRTKFEIGILSASVLGVGLAAVLGAFWRKWGRRWLTKLLRNGGVSMSDDIPNAWSALTLVGEEVHVTQLKICLSDGTLFFCDDLSRFKDHPNGPCVLGGAGDVLMYVTMIGKSDPAGKRVWTEVPNVVDGDFGAAMTYIPREQVARVELRRRKKV